MRIATITIAAVAAATAFAAPATAQSVTPPLVHPDKDATGKALILVPLSLTKIDDLDFGTLVPSSLSGFVAIDATSGNRTLGGGVTGPTSAAGHRATFAGAGTPNQQVIITYTTPTQLSDSTGDTIDVLALTLQGSAIKQVDPTSHAFTFGMGGILQIAADQPEGIYSASFTVSANYQ